MSKIISDFFTCDHQRIEGFLNEALKDPMNINQELYQKFRVGLLTHIKMEESILFPAALKANNGTPIPLAAQLKLDHGALTSLMVPPPSIPLINAVRYILRIHDELEEKPGGMYDICESLTQEQTHQLLEQLHKQPDVPVHPNNHAPFALDVAKRTLLRAGYNYDEISQ